MIRILLVDDDADIRRLVKRILESQGYHIVVVDNGLTALDELNSESYDILLSDAKMPYYSGFELIKALRKIQKHKELSIAMLTGCREKEEIQKAIQLGVDDYIVKPITPTVLLEKVEKLVNKIKIKKGYFIAPEKKQGQKTLAGQLTHDIEVESFDGEKLRLKSSIAFPNGYEMNFQLATKKLQFSKVKVLSCKAHETYENYYTLQLEANSLSRETEAELNIYLNKKKAS